MNVKQYLQNHARKLDLRLYEYLFEDASTQPVLDELSQYQNTDGGFGHALEPDLRLPDSSALATTVAFQYLSQLRGVSADSPMVAKAIQYLIGTYDDKRNGWVNIPPSADQHPRAPWWNYESAKSSTEWGNPSAEILGYLLKYTQLVQNAALLDKLSERAVRRLNEIADPELHEIKCYVRLYDNADEQLQKQLYPSLAKYITEATETDPKGWQGYVATPLAFITSPESPFASLFDAALLVENVQHLHSQMTEDGRWEPTWSWGQFENEWAQAKVDWSGKLTVENLWLLKQFGANS